MAHTRMFQFDAPVSPRREPIGLMRIWVPLIFLITTAEAIAIPLRIVLGPESMSGFGRLDVVVMVLFLLDLLVNVWGARRHGSGGGAPFLAADAVAALPLHLLFGWFPLVIVRLAKLVRVAHWMTVWRRRHFNRWNVLRLVYFVYWLALSVHLLATGWLALRGIPPGEDGWTRYLHSLYWCISTLTTIGYGDITPSTNAEIFYAMTVMIFGVGMYGYVIANISTIITNLQPARGRYLEHMEKLGVFMHYRGIPPGLQHRIREYYSYIWEQRLAYDESSIVHGLPPGLRADVSLFLKRDIIQKVPFFKAAGDDLVRDIALQMKPVVYTPGDVVFRRGEPGAEMYFISHGEVQVMGESGGTVLATLRDGDFFGEMALLLHQPRTATVRAVGYCDLYTLDKTAFEGVVRKYPEFSDHIRAMTAERQEHRTGG